MLSGDQSWVCDADGGEGPSSPAVAAGASQQENRAPLSGVRLAPATCQLFAFDICR